MNIDLFTQLLERARVHEGRVRAGAGSAGAGLRRWRPLAPLLDKALEGEDEVEEYAGTFEGLARERQGTPRGSADLCVRC